MVHKNDAILLVGKIHIYTYILYLYICVLYIGIVYIWLILTEAIFKTNIAQCKLLPLTGNA